MPPRGGSDGPGRTVTVNRAPVLTLWAAVVAERLGFDRAEALTLGKTVAGLNAQSKGRGLGIYAAAKGAEARPGRREIGAGKAGQVLLLHRAVPCIRTPDGIRALAKGRPVTPESVERYLASKFGEALAPARSAMEALARAFEPDDLREGAFALYEQFRPEVPKGVRGWGAAGVLDLGLIRLLARRGRGG